MSNPYYDFTPSNDVYPPQAIYSCNHCGALVPSEVLMRHAEWHRSIAAGLLAALRGEPT